MKRMKIKYNEWANAFVLTDEEARSLADAHDKGEKLVWRDAEKGQCITLEGGVLTLTGFTRTPIVFSSITPLGVPNTDSTVICELKTRIKRAVVGEGARSIESGVFRNCPNLTEVTVPDTVTSIGGFAPQSEGLLPFNIPAGVTYLGGGAIPHPPKHLALPEGLKELHQRFAGCDVESVKIPGSLKTLSSETFKNCASLSKLEIGEGVEYIEWSVFYGCSSLKSVKLPKSIKIIREFAFARCTSLTEIEIPSHVVVHHDAFAHCTSLTEVKIGEGCYVSDEAFSDTPYFKRINAGWVERLPRRELAGDGADIADLDKARERLAGLSLTEQAKRLLVHIYDYSAEYSYGELDSESECDTQSPLEEELSVEEIITHDGIIVGIVINGYEILLGEDKCTYSASEDDGPGRRSVTRQRGLLLAE